jgi:hypothetical protein
MVAAANLHVPLEDVLAGFVGLTRSGYDAANASTQLAGIITHLVNPSAAARKEIDALSKSTGVDLSQDFGLAAMKSKGLVAILQDLMHATHGNEDALLHLIPAQRGAIGALALTGNAAGDVADAMNQLNGVIDGQSTPTAVAYARITQTLGFQWNVLKARFDLAKIALGDELMPVVMRSLNWIMDEAPKAAAAFSSVFDAFRAGNFNGGMATLGNFLEPLVTQITAFLPRVLDAIGAFVPVVAAKMLEVAGAMTDWVLTTAVPRLISSLPRIQQTISDFITATLPILAQDTIRLASQLTT